MSLRKNSVRAISGVDAYARAEGHLVERTTIGAIITIVGAIIALLLFANELSVLMQPLRIEQMGVDLHRSDLLRLNLNMSFPRLPCQALSMDLADLVTGVRNVAVNTQDTQLARSGQIHKYRLDRMGGHIGAQEYIRPRSTGGFLFQTLGDMQDPAAVSKALKDQEGCQIEGWLEVQRVAGNFHVSVSMEDFFMLEETQKEMAAALKQAQNHSGPGHPIFLDLAPDTSKINMSHVFHHLSFGSEEFPGQVHPLDGHQQICDHSTGTFKYFLKIVPTEYQDPKGHKFQTSQFSVTEYYTKVSKGRGQMPAVFLIYDLFSLTVTVTDSRRSLAHFLVRVCAVLGGVFAVTGMIDRLVHHFVVPIFRPPPPRLRPGLINQMANYGRQ